MLTALKAEHARMKVGHSMWQPLQNIFECRKCQSKDLKGGSKENRTPSSELSNKTVATKAKRQLASSTRLRSQPVKSWAPKVLKALEEARGHHGYPWHLQWGHKAGTGDNRQHWVAEVSQGRSPERKASLDPRRQLKPGRNSFRSTPKLRGVLCLRISAVRPASPQKTQGKVFPEEVCH